MAQRPHSTYKWPYNVNNSSSSQLTGQTERVGGHRVESRDDATGRGGCCVPNLMRPHHLTPGVPLLLPYVCVGLMNDKYSRRTIVAQGSSYLYYQRGGLLVNVGSSEFVLISPLFVYEDLRLWSSLDRALVASSGNVGLHIRVFHCMKTQRKTKRCVSVMTIRVSSFSLQSQLRGESVIWTEFKTLHSWALRTHTNTHTLMHPQSHTNIQIVIRPQCWLCLV